MRGVASRIPRRLASGALTVVAIVGALICGPPLSAQAVAPGGAASAAPRSTLTFTNRTTAQGLGNNRVNGIYVVDDSVYAATDGGLSISSNGGATFVNRVMNNGMFSVSANDVTVVDDTVYVATSGGLFVSGDGGATFVPRTAVSNGLANDSVYGVSAVDDTVYAATTGGLSISGNGGQSFVNRNTGNSTIGNDFLYDVYAVDDSVYAATLGGLSISGNGGQSFVNKNTGNSAIGGNSIFGTFALGSAVYAATNGGLSISGDGGGTFVNRTATSGLGSNDLRGVYATGSAIYVATAPFGGKPGGLSISTDGGATFANYTTANGLGSSTVFDSFVSGRTVYAATLGGLSIAVIPEPPPPLPPVPPAAPGDVVAVAGDRSAVVSWSSPSDSGSYPVSAYQVEASPGGRSFLVPVATTTCELTGLSNGTSYTFAVRALSGAGWGPWSSPSAAVTPRAAVIVITGGRVDRRTVAVTGVTSGLSGPMVVPWLRFAGEREAVAWVPRPVEADGTFTWSRRTGRQLKVYFAQGSVRSNTISIPAVAAGLVVPDVS